MRAKKAFILAVIIPLAILASLTLKPATTVFLGEEILLETKAYDPTDLFRGDYVAINLKISDIPKTLLPIPLEEVEQNKNTAVYVGLKPGDKFYILDRVSLEKPQEGIYLTGRIQYYNFDSDILHVDYNMDKYFLKQGTGLALQEASYQGALAATVKVYKGYGMLTNLTVDRT
jgi:uncharacterized membrane-anchored protein